MSDNYQCRWCKVTDEKVLEWTIYRQEWRGKVAAGFFYAHMNCHIKEMSANGDGHGVKVGTA